MPAAQRLQDGTHRPEACGNALRTPPCPRTAVPAHRPALPGAGRGAAGGPRLEGRGRAVRVGERTVVHLFIVVLVLLV